MEVKNETMVFVPLSGCRGDSVESMATYWLGNSYKHWYCDGPKPITRKEFYLYEDKACTKFIKTWSVEAPVGVQ